MGNLTLKIIIDFKNVYDDLENWYFVCYHCAKAVGNFNLKGQDSKTFSREHFVGSHLSLNVFMYVIGRRD